MNLSIQKVKPEWIDYNGHMNIAYYTMAFDNAMDEFLQEKFGMDEKYVAKAQCGPFALQSTYNYLAELRIAEEFSVSPRVIDFDHKRIHMFSSLWRLKDGVLSATCESLSTFVDHKTRKSTPFPESILKNIEDMYCSTANHPMPDQVGQTIGIRRNKS